MVRFITSYLAMMILLSCAQVGTPSGGAYDVDPPKIISIYPELGATGVSINEGGTIIVTFDEYVKVRDLNTQLLVSPPLLKPVEWSMRGKTVTFTWTENLKENTTYVFQFGDAIIDVREGNPAENFLHAFSTGTVLDTLSLKGTVQDVFTSEAKSDVRIFMYEESVSIDSISDSFLHIKPKFVTTTNSLGEFDLEYLPRGNYRIIAVSDDDRDYAWSGGEALGILQDVVEISGADSISSPIRLQETPPSPLKYFVKQSIDSLGLIEIELSSELEKGDTLYVGERRSFIDGTTLWVWSEKEREISDEEFIIWSGADTLNLSEVGYVATKSVEVISAPEGQQISTTLASIKFSRPIYKLHENLFELSRLDTIAESIEIDSIWVDQTSPFSIQLKGNFGRGEVLSLLLLPGSVEGQGGVVFKDSTEIKWSTFHKNELGELKVIIDRTGWLELISPNGEVVRKEKLNKGESVYFKNITPGSYELKWTGDENENGYWDEVDLKKWQAPEEAILMPSKIKIKADWSHEIKWLN
ncbi:MAG: hypothetical protein COA49_04175 [Bacteroidetes bacterium]|nr:MAG: hypothetical protein COA49_04175 [Bacteroidota bacterium]